MIEGEDATVDKVLVLIKDFNVQKKLTVSDKLIGSAEEFKVSGKSRNIEIFEKKFFFWKFEFFFDFENFWKIGYWFLESGKFEKTEKIIFFPKFGKKNFIFLFRIFNFF